MALAYAALMVVLYWLLVLRVRERPDFVARKSNPLVPGVRRSLRNRPFSVLFFCYVVASIPGAIPGLLMPYFSRYVLNPPPVDAGVAQSWLSIFLAAYFLSGLVCLPLWLVLAKRIGKLNAWLDELRHGHHRRARAVPARAGRQPGVPHRDRVGGLELRRGAVPAAGDPGRRDRLRRAAHRQAARGAVPGAVGAGAEVHRDPERVAAARAAGVARLPAEPAAVARGADRDPRGLRADAVGVLDRGVLHRLALPDQRDGAPRDPRGGRGAPARRVGGRSADQPAARAARRPRRRRGHELVPRLLLGRRAAARAAAAARTAR